MKKTSEYPRMEGGWDMLLTKIYDFVGNLQESWLELAPEKITSTKCFDQTPDNQAFSFQVLQVKEKLSLLRLYWDVQPLDFDWSVYNKDKYFIAFDKWRHEITGFVWAMESVSGMVCENCGERGSQKDCNGWLKTLCEKCYEKRGSAAQN